LAALTAPVATWTVSASDGPFRLQALFGSSLGNLLVGQSVNPLDPGQRLDYPAGVNWDLNLWLSDALLLRSAAVGF